MFKFLQKILDWFYPLFSKVLSREFYYYLASGGINTVLNWVFYFIIYNYIVAKQEVSLGWLVMSPHIASLVIVTPITLTIGFLLSKNITFSSSKIKTGTQFFRYSLIIFANFAISYLSMKFWVEAVGLWATPSNMLTTIITTIFSYLMQKFYSFRMSETDNVKQ